LEYTKQQAKIKQQKLIIDNLRADQMIATKNDLGSQIIKDKNKEF